MFWDAGLSYDRETRRCDLAIGADGDLVIDETPITPILLSIGLDRRAADDDELPQGRSAFLAPTSFSERRGAPGDALDATGVATGSKIWLLDRAKESEETRLLFAMWLEDCLAWAASETGTPAEISVEWARPELLAYRVAVDGVSVRQTRDLG